MKGSIVVVFEDGAISICDSNCGVVVTNEDSMEQKTKAVEGTGLYCVGDSLLLIVIQQQKKNLQSYILQHFHAKDTT